MQPLHRPPPPPASTPADQSRGTLPKLGLGRPGGSRVLFAGTRALKNKPAASQGVPPRPTGEALRLSGPPAARPAAPGPSLSRREGQLEARGTLGGVQNLLRGGPVLLGASGLEEYVEFPNLAFRNCFL